MKKSYIKIIFIVSLLILVLFAMKESSSDEKFVDINFKANIVESANKENLKEEDLAAITFLTFTRDEGIENFEDLKKFSALDNLSLIGFSQNEINNILENCTVTLLHLDIDGDTDYSLGSTVLSVSNEINISTSGQIAIYPIEDSDTFCKRLWLSANEIKGIEYIGVLKDMELLDLRSEEGFDEDLDCALIAENSPEISEFNIEGGKISNYESIVAMGNLEALILHNTGIENVTWAEGLLDKISYMIIQEEEKYFIENVFEDN